MWNIFILIMNVVFSIMAGVIFAAAIGSDWWLLMFFIGFLLWNITAGAILLVIGFVLSIETVGKVEK
jgi:hypothetical protein